MAMTMVTNDTILMIVFIIIIVSSLYLSLIHSIDYYYFHFGSSLTGRCGRDYVEVETARYHRYNNIELDNILFMKAVMVIFSLYLLYIFLFQYLAPTVSTIMNDETETNYNHWYDNDTYISKWTFYTTFVFTTLITSLATVAGNFSRGSVNLDYLALLYLLPLGMIWLSNMLNSETELLNYFGDGVFLTFNMYLVTVITSIIQANKEKVAELPLVLGAITIFLLIVVIIYKYNYNNIDNNDVKLIQPVFYGIVVSIIMGIFSAVRFNETKSDNSKYREIIVKLDAIFQPFFQPDKEKYNKDFNEYVIKRYNQLNKIDKHTYNQNNVINDNNINTIYLGGKVTNDLDNIDLRKLPVMYIPFFEGGQVGLERLIQHLKNSGVTVDIIDETKRNILQLYGELTTLNQEPNDIGTVLSGFMFLTVGYFTVSAIMTYYKRVF